MVCVLLLVATICNAAPSPKHYLVETVDNAGPGLNRRSDTDVSLLKHNCCNQWVLIWYFMSPRYKYRFSINMCIQNQMQLTKKFNQSYQNIV